MKLTESKIDKFYQVISLNGNEQFLKRITSIGLTKDTTIQVIKNDRKMPVLIYVRDSLVALNRKDCELIEVKEISNE